ncbi:uncharacterized protein LODBEIA_P55070 [Lodderomyces beijingensis]|uniref:Origin recognition complex subunit 4 n=1 Tax=Lodderomyces beijingensis TaxID=1775926 RepID=A0ABP0ZUF6_9ASCO
MSQPQGSEEDSEGEFPESEKSFISRSSQDSHLKSSDVVPEQQGTSSRKRRSTKLLVEEIKIKQNKEGKKKTKLHKKYKKIEHIEIRDVPLADIDSSQTFPPQSNAIHTPSEAITSNYANQVDQQAPIPDEDLQKIKSHVLHKLNGNFKPRKQSSLEDAVRAVHEIIQRTVFDRESHSMLVLGPRASGKTSIVKQALKQLREEHGEYFISVELNSAVHSDDGGALREIARQLDVKVLDYYDDAPEDHTSSVEKKSINETFSNILQILSNGQKDQNSSSTPLIFVIDEFEKFTASHRQTLLYNLLDLSQNSSIPITVIGLSTKMNVKDSLEKRVSSRFSQRILSIAQSQSYSDFLQEAKTNISLSEEFINSLQQRESGLRWNEELELLFEREKNNFGSIHNQNFHTVKNFAILNNTYKLIVAAAQSQPPLLLGSDCFAKLAASMPSHNFPQAAIGSLSKTELLLMIAASRWTERYDSHTINFNLAYTEYSQMVKDPNVGKTGSSLNSLSYIQVQRRSYSRKLLRNSWEVLYKSGLLVDPQASNGGLGVADTRSKSGIIEENSLVALDVSLADLNTYVPEGSPLKKYVTI